MSKSVADEDLTRYLDKWEDTAKRCFEFFTKTSEAAAAQHLGDKVFYSPICNRLNEMLQDMTILRARVGEETE